MKNKILIILFSALILTSCQAYKIVNSPDEVTFETEYLKITFNNKKYNRYLPDIKYKNSVRSYWINSDWFVQLKTFETKYFDSDLVNITFELTDLKKNIFRYGKEQKIPINNYDGFSYGGFIEDSTLGSDEHKIGILDFILIKSNVITRCRIIKYHYKQSDKQEFQNILNRFTITEKN